MDTHTDLKCILVLWSPVCVTLGGATGRGRREPPGGVRTVPAVAARVPDVLLSTWGAVTAFRSGVLKGSCHQAVAECPVEDPGG